MNEAGWGVTFGFAAAMCALIWFNAPAETPAETAAEAYVPQPEPAPAAPAPAAPAPAQWGWDDDLSDLIGPQTRAPEAW
jgi:hypothetical protein